MYEQYECIAFIVFGYDVRKNDVVIFKRRTFALSVARSHVRLIENLDKWDYLNAHL